MSSSRVGGVLEGGVGPGMLGGARMPVVLVIVGGLVPWSGAGGVKKSNCWVEAGSFAVAGGVSGLLGGADMICTLGLSEALGYIASRLRPSGVGCYGEWVDEELSPSAVGPVLLGQGCPLALLVPFSLVEVVLCRILAMLYRPLSM